MRTVPLPIFTHFMQVATLMYGDIPVNKGEDDGAIFSSLLKSSRFPSEQRPGKWEVLKEILEKYKVRLCGPYQCLTSLFVLSDVCALICLIGYVPLVHTILQ